MDADKLKDFAVYNFEKLIVAIVVVMSALLINSGLGKPIITEKHDPENLAQRATEVKRQVDDDHTEAIVHSAEASREPTFDIAKELDKFRQPIKASLYQPSPWDVTKASKDKIRRKDPELGKPLDVRATGVVASLAWRSKNGVYALTELEPADELEVVEVKQKRPSKRQQRMEMMMMGEGGDMSGMDFEADMMAMGFDTGAAAGAPGAGRKLAPEDNLGTTAKSTKNIRNGDDEPPVPGIGLFIAGTAVIPHKELIKSYQEALSYAADYDPRSRDLPLYVAYEVQRADVTNKSVDQLTDADWIVRDTNTLTIFNAASYWSGFAPEFVPDDYWIPGVTMWVPPVLLDPYASFASHPLIPLKSKRELDNEQALRELEESKANAGPATLQDFEIDVAGGRTRSYGGMGSMEMGMEEYDMGMEDYDMGMGGGGMATRSINEGKPAEENPVDYKLLRFYDFYYVMGAPADKNAPKVGRSYVYRTRFAVNDPNFPQKPELQPQGRNLDPDAYKRFVALSAEAGQTQKRNFTRWSEWSDPSAAASLPAVSFDKAAFGYVKSSKPRTGTIGNREVRIETDPPVADVIASSFDPKLGVFVPAAMEVTEGSVLSTEVQTADVVDPITLEVKKTTEPRIIRSSAAVIDIEGGVPMEIVSDEAILEPGMFLMVDSEGRLQVRDTAEDQRVYRIKSFAKDRGL